MIASPANARIKDLIKKKAHPAAECFFIEGPHLAGSALQSAAAIRDVYYTAAFAASEGGKELLAPLSRKAGRVFEVSEPVMRKLAATESPQGIVAVVSQPVLRIGDLSPGEAPLLAVLEGIQDPGNAGTIIRIADAAGADVVIALKGTCSPYLEKAVRATAGSIFTVPVIEARTDEFLKWIKAKRVALAVTAADGDQSIFATPLTGSLAFAFGNEAHGISSTLRDAADMSISIPIYGRAESLNVATAAAVCLYEAARQRKGPEHTA